MEVTVKKINRFLMVKLPAAFFCGVRLRLLENKKAVVVVKHRWISQNPFNSMYFAVQSMAAELSTGALLIKNIEESNQKISMLLANHNGAFTKKATGLITFMCNDGLLVHEQIKKAIETGEGQIVKLKSFGVDEVGDQVSEYEFEWSIKLKSIKK